MNPLNFEECIREERTNVRENDHEYVNNMVLCIKDSFGKEGEIDMIRQLKTLIPEFKSNVSRFSALD